MTSLRVVSKQCSGKSHVDDRDWSEVHIFWQNKAGTGRLVSAAHLSSEQTCHHRRRTKWKPKEVISLQVNLRAAGLFFNASSKHSGLCCCTVSNQKSHDDHEQAVTHWETDSWWKKIPCSVACRVSAFYTFPYFLIGATSRTLAESAGIVLMGRPAGQRGGVSCEVEVAGQTCGRRLLTVDVDMRSGLGAAGLIKRNAPRGSKQRAVVPSSNSTSSVQVVGKAATFRVLLTDTWAGFLVANSALTFSWGTDSKFTASLQSNFQMSLCPS